MEIDIIGEDRRDISWVMKDGIWFKENSYEYNPLCDLIIVYNNNPYGVAIELKGSHHKRHKAESQVLSGKHFIEDVLGLSYRHGKVVFYHNGRYDMEVV